MTVWILSLLSALFIGLTLLPFSKSEVWWVRAADFPRVQFSGFGIALVGASVLCLERDAWLTWPVERARIQWGCGLCRCR